MAKRKYRVTGELPVAGHAPGEEFTHDFGEHEAALIEGGHIRPARESGEKPADEQKEG